MPKQYPKEFNMRDLFIDVKLEACVNGTTFDFLGRKLFSTEFFRDSIGFGIINIDIEVNTSLQPIVSIVFKDLYGATIFGGQNREKDIDGQSIDFSVLFDWPPPKFLFSFKGYLGNPVSWMLNLKRTTTSFNSSDGSYEVKCEFVPNQWGFFADMPMLFLLASKAMRRERLGSNPTPKEREAVTSVFDLVKIGKQVEIKTQDTTKEFDDLVKQLGSIKSNIAGTLSSSRIVNFGDKIDGVVNNIPIKNFVTIDVPNLSDLDSAINTEEKVNLKLGDPNSLSRVNTYMLLKLKFNKKVAYSTGTVGSFDYKTLVPSDPKISTAKNQVIEAINKNLRLVEDEIKRRVFSSSELKLQKITIGEIFGQLGKDAAFIIGTIIESGLEGYGKNTGERDSNEKKLIGQSFPLIISDDGDEVPATQENLAKVGVGQDLGVDTYEMDFVRKFINAISEGVAKDLLKDGGSSLAEDDTLKSRINNIEMTKENPYKPFYEDIATNILVRGGIVGFLTRGADPNRPGDYGNNTSFDNDGPEDIIAMADREITNITDKIVNELSDVDALLLKRFCKFITRFYEENGVYLRKKDGDGALVEGNAISSPSVGNYEVVMEDSPEVKLTFSQIFKELRKDEEIEKVEDIYATQAGAWTDSLPPSPIHPLSFVDNNYTAKKIINNGIGYTLPTTSADRYWYVVFEGDDNVKAQEALSAPTDAEYKDEDKDDPANMFFTAEKPLGYVPISAVLDSDGNEFGRVTTLKDRIASNEVVDYAKLRSPSSSFYDIAVSSGYDNYQWKKEIYDSREDAIAAGKKPGEYAVAGDLGYTIFSNFDLDTFGDAANIFEMFSDDVRSRNQRIFIRRVCKLLLDKITKLEEERNQVIGSVLGKAAEQETAIYKQMHTLYHQWQVLSYGSENGGCGQNVGSNLDLVKSLEEKYGGNHRSITSETDLNGLPDGAFVYEFPLQRIKGVEDGKKAIQVRDSIINIEPLYKLNGETSVLNIIQQVCTKNNFLFVPIPGNASYMNVSDIYSPSMLHADIDIRNFFHVLFTPTPESRAKSKNGGTPFALSENHKTYDTNSFVIQYGHPDNQIVNNIQVGTDDNKVTAESVVNLQRLVDNENQNKTVTTDCSTLPILEGRSYNASIDMIGNAQVYPMQFFFLENSPLFGGLYQVMKVKHSITPNDMKTSVSGMRMRFSDGGGYGSIKPITLDTFKNLGAVESAVPFSKDEIQDLSRVSITDPNAEAFSSGKPTDWPYYAQGATVPINIAPPSKGNPPNFNLKVTFNKYMKNEYLPIINSIPNKTKGLKMLALVMANKEGFYAGSRSYSTNNPGNVGNTDNGSNNSFPNLKAGINGQMSYLYKVAHNQHSAYKIGSNKDIKPYYSKEIDKNQKSYQLTPYLPGYKFTYTGTIEQFVKIYATGARGGNSYISIIVSFFRKNGFTTCTEETTIAELLAFNNSSPIIL